MNNVTLYLHRGGELVKYQDQPFLFSAGEPHINFTDPDNIYRKRFIIEVRGGNFSDLGTAMVLRSALCIKGAHTVDLFIPYFPAGRMDRDTSTQPFTLQIYCQYLKLYPFDRVYTVDPHSPEIENQLPGITILPFMPNLAAFVPTDTTIIAPDAGAAVRAKVVADHYGMHFVQASKVRDPNNNFKVGQYSCPEVTTPNAVVIDDICDGGYTFQCLAETINHPNLHLFVTHGIFSKGLGQLRKHYQSITTTDSLNRDHLDSRAIPSFLSLPDYQAPLLPLLEKELNK